MVFKAVAKLFAAKRLSAVLVAGFILFSSVSVLADGIPHNFGINLQEPATPVEANIHEFHNLLLWVISAITIFVLGLLLYVVARYNKWTNPTPTTTTHNVKLEILWTLLPILILVALAFKSFPLLYYTDRVPPSDLTLKVTGHQWYWSYEYPDNGNVSFDSHAIWDSSDVTEDQSKKLIADAEPNWLIKRTPLRLLEVDNPVVLPVGKTVRVQIAGADVEHSWFIPSVGVNRMAVPGHLTEVWVKLNHEGLYYGQCSMICGNGHGYMPIVVEGVSPERFAAWAEAKKTNVGQGIQLDTPKFAEAH